MCSIFKKAEAKTMVQGCSLVFYEIGDLRSKASGRSFSELFFFSFALFEMQQDVVFIQSEYTTDLKVL
jgi:hypothetical protein